MGLGTKVEKTPSVTIHGLPSHVAIIMDGNGRWAEHHGKPRTEGHSQGGEAVRRIVRACRRLGIQHLTLYAFSEQNWNRPNTEVSSLMALLQKFLISERLEILDNAIRLRTIGRTERLPANVRSLLLALERDSGTHNGMTLTLALSYGGREEIADAARAIAEQVQSGRIEPEAVSEDVLGEFLPSMKSGPVDLMIRTGGEQRISNFLLWGAAYAELFFSEKLWPEFTEHDLYLALEAFQSRERRFGRVRPYSNEAELAKETHANTGTTLSVSSSVVHAH